MTDNTPMSPALSLTAAGLTSALKDENKMLREALTEIKDIEVSPSPASTQEAVTFAHGPVGLKYRDGRFLEWIADRLHHVHGENPRADYMLRLREIGRRVEYLTAAGLVARLAVLEDESKTLREELDVREGDLFMLRKAVDAGDPKSELLVRIDDALRETRAALSKPAALPAEGKGEASSMLSNLLARIHRDGGHYEAEHGTAKAVADADDIVANLYAATPPAPQPLEGAVKVERVETGPVRIGDDWAGIFIRGDNALHWAFAAAAGASALREKDVFGAAALEGLAKTLRSCREPCEVVSLSPVPQPVGEVLDGWKLVPVVERLEAALTSARSILRNMALENERAIFRRWPIHHEPLRADARGVLPFIDDVLDAARRART